MRARGHRRRERGGGGDEDRDGLDRAQITAQWVDTETGEMSTGRGSRRRIKRVCGVCARSPWPKSWRSRWRQRPAGDSSLMSCVVSAQGCVSPSRPRPHRGAGTRSGPADARHIRELLMIGRLPESWAAPDAILDLRARVRLRHMLSHERAEWKQGRRAPRSSSPRCASAGSTTAPAATTRGAVRKRVTSPKRAGNHTDQMGYRVIASLQAFCTSASAIREYVSIDWRVACPA